MLHDIVAAFLAEHCIGDWHAYLQSDAAKPEVLDRVRLLDAVSAGPASVAVRLLIQHESFRCVVRLLQACFADATEIAATEVCNSARSRSDAD